MSKAIKILVIGEPVGKIARKALIQELPKLKKKYKPDLTITNGENASHGLGITQNHLQELHEAGIDFFTSGNHIWDKPEIEPALAEKDPLIIRPANYPADLPGTGEKILTVGQHKILILNLLGRVFIKDNIEDPFRMARAWKEKYKPEDFSAILLDFHAEATSEKEAMGHYLDGWASAVWGTHQHIATADYKILNKGTAYVTDIGKTGAKDSVLGVDKEIIIYNFFYPKRKAHELVDNGTCEINANIITINTTDRRATAIERIYLEVQI
ncbi:TIGR00282 family metallophosphoesterase [Candidatus Uhrbacteria bacterium]|nr:TIGR00282 family metallophosphoesterase [Candidatus Uhrbacteria bacterium]